MKNIFFFLALLIIKTSFAQTEVLTQYGVLQFIELDHGYARVVDGTVEKLKKSPTGNHGWLKNFEITEVTDSIRTELKTNFGVVYMIKAKDTFDISVEIEWIYPEKITNEKGKKFESVKYTTVRPTNIPSASSYSIDAPYEMVKGNWIMNIYWKRFLMYSKTFILY